VIIELVDIKYLIKLVSWVKYINLKVSDKLSWQKSDMTNSISLLTL
jgi:hypothetical protein